MTEPPVSHPVPHHGLSGGRVALIVCGALLAVIGLALTAGGSALLIANQTLRDADGFFSSATERFTTPGRALATESLSVVGEAPVEIADNSLATVRVRATSVNPATPVFVGIARADDVNAYLAGVDHDRVRDVEYGPFHIEYVRRTGTATPATPASRSFWVASASGTGTQTVEWVVASGTWSVVAMNADGSPGVSVNAKVGAKFKYVAEIGIGLLAGGVVLLVGAGTLIYFGARRHRTDGDATEAVSSQETAGAPTATPHAPVWLEGRLDADPNRWLWLVKWVLTIPHWFVLAFLWLALWVLSVIAFFAILFTGRYPRGIFEFNVGVLRWTWRVSFYAYSALGTDRYPPFTLADVPDYPARFGVAYPERLSRGLVLVKSWLLAIPHLILVAVFAGGWAIGAPSLLGFADGDGWGWEGAPGLIGVLTLIAAIALLFTGRYPRGIFDLVMGLNRWVFRVAAYVGLMRDEYPPFRLDMGAHEPGDPPADGRPSGGREGHAAG